MDAKQILGVVPGLQATSLVAQNIPKKFPMKPQKGMGMVKLGVKNLVGISLIRPTSSLINSL